MANLPKLGIDIGAASIKVVELDPAGKNKWKLLTAAAMTAPVGSLIAVKSNQSAAVTAVAKLVKEAGAKSKRVVASLPEEQISSHVVTLPLMAEGEVEQALQWQVEQYIPIPKEQAAWSYDILKKDTTAGTMEVLLIAVPKNVAEAYQQVLELAGLEPVALETELMGIARSLVPPEAPLGIVADIGAKSTDVGVVRGGQLLFAHTIPTAGEAFTRAIETALGLDTTQAEQYKNTYGFSASQLQGKLVEAMKPVLTVIAGEIRKTVDFYIGKHPGEIIRTLTLSGGVAALPDVVTHLSSLLGMEVIIGNPFARIETDDRQRKAIVGNEPFYAVAVGLAMKEGK